MKKSNIDTLELGYMMFGTNKTQEYILPEYACVLLKDLREQLDDIIGYENNPFGNTGAKFKIDGVFEVESYSWDEDYEQPYNFKYKDIEISWYKYFGRDTTINAQFKPERIVEMYETCSDAIKDYAQKHGYYDEEDGDVQF